MKPSYTSAFGLGALAGLIIALSALLFVGATGGTAKLEVIGEGTGIEPAFAIPASAFWMVSIVAGAVCGLILALVTHAIGKVIDPDAQGAPVWVVGLLGVVVGGVVSFAIFPLGSTVLGSVQDGVATVTVADITILTAVAGLAGGAAIAWQSYIMTRPPQAKEDPELLAA